MTLEKRHTFEKMLGMKIRCCAGAAVNDAPLLLQYVLRRRAISAADQYECFGYIL